jgi:hypothetical protein
VGRSTLLAERLSAQLLAGPPGGDVLDVVRRLLAVQAQDPRGARLAVRARSVGLQASDVDRALTEDRSIVVSTLNRGTLHLVRSEDYWWLHDLTTPQLVTSSARRLAQEKVSADQAERGVTIITRALSNNGPMGRQRLRGLLADAGIPVAGQAFVHIALLATLRGLIVRGPVIDGEHAFVLVTDWLGNRPAPSNPDVALGELARRYLAGHGPATDADLARWAGITIGAARRGLGLITSQLVDRDDGLAAVADRSGTAELPEPLLLGAFDPSLLGWASREQIIGSHAGIVTTNGVFRPFAMVKGKAVATWRLDRGRIAMTPFASVSRPDRTKLAAEEEAVLEFLSG